MFGIKLTMTYLVLDLVSLSETRTMQKGIDKIYWIIGKDSVLIWLNFYINMIAASIRLLLAVAFEDSISSRAYLRSVSGFNYDGKSVSSVTAQLRARWML